MKFINVLLTLSSLLFWQISGAVENAKAPATDETDFFAIVNETGGYISHKLHQQFWEMLKAKYSEEKREKFVLDIQSVLGLLKEFQEATWQSAKQSYYAKKQDKSQGYQTLKDQLLKQQTQYFSPQVIVANAEKIITSSAERSPLDLGAGNFYITPELIEENLIGIKGSYERLKLLLSPTWKEEYKEYTLPKMALSILSLYPPDEYQEFFSHNDETVNIHVSQLCVDKNSIYEMGAVDYQKGDKKFSHFSPEERTIYMQEFVKEQFAGYKINDPLLSKGTWRGFEYVKGMGSIENYHIVILNLFPNDKALYIKYVTEGDLTLANSNFNDFMKRIQIEKGSGA